MIQWRNWFNISMKLKIQIFGKLPFYRDYLRYLSFAESENWYKWLVDTFSDNGELPEGRRPFIFQYSPGTDPVVGLIEPGTDGIRKFPFSLFVVADKSLLKDGNLDRYMPLFMSALESMRSRMDSHVSDVDIFYRFIKGQMVVIKKIKETKPLSETDSACALLNNPNISHPVFLIFRRSGSGFELLENLKRAESSHV